MDGSFLAQNQHFSWNPLPQFYLAFGDFKFLPKPNRGLKIFHTLRWGQTIKFVKVLFQIKFNFSIKNIFYRVVS